MIWKDFERDIKKFVREKMKGLSHGFDHVLRVVRLSKRIGEIEGADLDVLMPAAYLHDVARMDEKTRGVDHAIEGARIASEFLKKIGYPEDKIPFIEHAIRVHRFRSKEEPKTLEAKILRDADRLDALGAIGIYRVITHSCEEGRDMEDTIRHFEEKILKLSSSMQTETARKIAGEREEVVRCFLNALRSELYF